MQYRYFQTRQPMNSMLKIDPTTLANMTTALEYVYRKLPLDRDNDPIRKYIAQEVIATANKGPISLGGRTNVGLKIANSYVFPPRRSWLKALGD